MKFLSTMFCGFLALSACGGGGSEVSLASCSSEEGECSSLDVLEGSSGTTGAAIKLVADGEDRQAAGTWFDVKGVWDADVAQQTTKLTGTAGKKKEVFFDTDEATTHAANYEYEVLYADVVYDYVQAFAVVDSSRTIYLGYHGVVTKASAIPDSKTPGVGTATYKGESIGEFTPADGYARLGLSPSDWSGTSEVTADFATGTATVILTMQTGATGEKLDTGFGRISATGLEISGNTLAVVKGTGFSMESLSAEGLSTDFSAIFSGTDDDAGGHFFGWKGDVSASEGGTFGAPDEVAGWISLSGSAGSIWGIFMADSVESVVCTAVDCAKLSELTEVSATAGAGYKLVNAGSLFDNVKGVWDAGADPQTTKLTGSPVGFPENTEVFFDADEATTHDANYEYRELDLHASIDTTFEYVQAFAVVDTNGTVDDSTDDPRVYVGYHGVVASAIPVGGTVVYTGEAYGEDHYGDREAKWSGTSSVAANFAEKTATVTIDSTVAIEGRPNFDEIHASNLVIDGNSFAKGISFAKGTGPTFTFLSYGPKTGSDYSGDASDDAVGHFYGWDSAANNNIGAPAEVAGIISLSNSSNSANLFVIFTAKDPS